MGIDFGKFKKKLEVGREIVILSDNLEKSDSMNSEMSDNLEKLDNSIEKESDNYKVPLEYLRTIHGILTGKTNHKEPRKRLIQTLIRLLKTLE